MLTHFNQMPRFFTPLKCQKSIAFLTISGVIETGYSAEMGKFSLKDIVIHNIFSILNFKVFFRDSA